MGALEKLKRKETVTSKDNAKKSKKKSGEEILYDPIKEYLYEKFSQFGKCEFEITSKKITEKVKKWLDDPALYFIRVEKKLPDIIGRFKPDRSKKLPYGFHEGLIITEVKDKEPTVKDITQIKSYAEIFDATFAYLISSKVMIEEVQRFLSKRSLLLSYYGAYRKVYIGKYSIIEGIDETAWYPKNPFPIKEKPNC